MRLLDEAAALACALDIDLNPIRAGKAETPEQSEFTSAYDRIQGRRQRAARAGLEVPADGGLLLDVHYADETDDDAWLAPLTLDAEQRLNGLLGQWFDCHRAFQNGSSANLVICHGDPNAPSQCPVRCEDHRCVLDMRTCS